MLSASQISSFHKDGYLVVEDFLNNNQRELLMNRAKGLIEDFDPSRSQSIFTTNEQERTSDEYFLKSGNQIRFFFEEKAIDSSGNFTVPKQQSINKKPIKLSKILICSRLGTSQEKIYYNTLKNLKNLTIKEPFCIIIPSKLHFTEEDFLKNFN